MIRDTSRFSRIFDGFNYVFLIVVRAALPGADGAYIRGLAQWAGAGHRLALSRFGRLTSRWIIMKR